MNVKQILETAKAILVVDYPNKEIPELLARAGFDVVVKGGPGPQDYYTYPLHNDEVVSRRTGHPPEHADLVYSYRPFSELPGIIELAKSLGAKTIWTQSGKSAVGTNDPKGCWVPERELQAARQVVEAAGLSYLSEPYIGDAARELQTKP